MPFTACHTHHQPPPHPPPHPPHPTPPPPPPPPPQPTPRVNQAGRQAWTRQAMHTRDSHKETSTPRTINEACPHTNKTAPPPPPTLTPEQHPGETARRNKSPVLDARVHYPDLKQ